MIQKVFNRYEKKYLLDQKTYEVFKKELDVYMAEDSTYFFEIKKKYNGLVNKRRIPLSREEAKKYLEEGDAPKETGQIYREVDYFFTHYGIRPKRNIAYDRLAMFGKDDPDFRVTFDVAIRNRTDNLTLQSDENTTLLLTPGYYLMEVKISDAMPKWFENLLSKYGIYNTSFSKYGMDQWRDLHCDCGRHRRPDLYGRFYGDLCRRKRWYHGRRTYGRTGYEQRYGWRTTG